MSSRDLTRDYIDQWELNSIKLIQLTLRVRDEDLNSSGNIQPLDCYLIEGEEQVCAI